MVEPQAADPKAGREWYFNARFDRCLHIGLLVGTVVETLLRRFGTLAPPNQRLETDALRAPLSRVVRRPPIEASIDGDG